MMSTDLMWCNQMWNSLADGGTWAVPRSGLVFQKDKAKKRLVLIARMPYEEGMPGTAEDLRAYQESDFQAIAMRFALIGVGLENDGS
jgi:hypothetical protein